MKTKQLVEFFEENDFNVHLTEQNGVQCAEVETWTDGGVNMIHFLNPFTFEEFENRVNDFDIDEEIELHRQGQDYKNTFTIKQSLIDFEEYHNRLKDVVQNYKQQ
jgi:hypothetical protein